MVLSARPLVGSAFPAAVLHRTAGAGRAAVDTHSLTLVGFSSELDIRLDATRP